MKYVFFGSPNFAAIILEKLIDAGMPPHALVCNPDKPVGRKQIITPPPIKEIGIKNKELGIKIFQPETKEKLIKIADQLFEEADFGIVAAYAIIIPKELLEKPKLGIIGVHPSLLPKYRGPSPIQSVILAGEKETGVTLFLMDEYVDHGPVISSKKLVVSSQDDYEILEKKLADLAGELLVETLPKFIKNETNLLPQDESQATSTKKLNAQDGYISPEDLAAATDGNSLEKALEIHRKILAFNPEPGVFSFLQGNQIKILKSQLKDKKLELKKIQHPGKKPVDL